MIGKTYTLHSKYYLELFEYYCFKYFNFNSDVKKKHPVKSWILAHFRAYFAIFHHDSKKIGYSRFHFQNLQPLLHEK